MAVPKVGVLSAPKQLASSDGCLLSRSSVELDMRVGSIVLSVLPLWNGVGFQVHVGKMSIAGDHTDLAKLPRNLELPPFELFVHMISSSSKRGSAVSWSDSNSIVDSGSSPLVDAM